MSTVLKTQEKIAIFINSLRCFFLAQQIGSFQKAKKEKGEMYTLYTTLHHLGHHLGFFQLLYETYKWEYDIYEKTHIQPKWQFAFFFFRKFLWHLWIGDFWAQMKAPCSTRSFAGDPSPGVWKTRGIYTLGPQNPMRSEGFTPPKYGRTNP